MTVRFPGFFRTTSGAKQRSPFAPEQSTRRANNEGELMEQTYLQTTAAAKATAYAELEGLQHRKAAIQAEQRQASEVLAGSQAHATVDDVARLQAQEAAYARILADLGKEIAEAARLAEKANQAHVHAQNQESKKAIQQTPGWMRENKPGRWQAENDARVAREQAPAA